MSSKLMRLGGPAMMLGGLLWVLMYGAEILLGVWTGEPYGDPSASALAWLVSALASGAIFFLGIGFVGLYARLRERSRKLEIAGHPPHLGGPSARPYPDGDDVRGRCAERDPHRGQRGRDL